MTQKKTLSDSQKRSKGYFQGSFDIAEQFAATGFHRLPPEDCHSEGEGRRQQQSRRGRKDATEHGHEQHDGRGVRQIEAEGVLPQKQQGLRLEKSRHSGRLHRQQQESDDSECNHGRNRAPRHANPRPVQQPLRRQQQRNHPSCQQPQRFMFTDDCTHLDEMLCQHRSQQEKQKIKRRPVKGAQQMVQPVDVGRPRTQLQAFPHAPARQQGNGHDPLG